MGLGEIRGVAHVAEDACRCGRCRCRDVPGIVVGLKQPDDPGLTDMEKPESMPIWLGMARNAVMTLLLLGFAVLVIAGYKNYNTALVISHPVELNAPQFP